MRPEPVRVAIDLETTGLRPEQDVIIEIGAVKFAGPQILDTFQSFVSLASQLPYRIHRLTGITSADLRRAPQLSALLSRLRAFIGSAPLVGHSVSFDASFLRRVGLAHRNPLIDTYELASMLLPDLQSYTLASVADALQVPSSIHHRALADADLSRAVFLALMERLTALDTSTIGELAALPSPDGWTPAYLLRSEARAREEAVKSSPFASLLTSTSARQPVAAGVHPALATMAVALDGRTPSGAAQKASTGGAVAAPGAEDQLPAREPWASLQAFMRDGSSLLLEIERHESALVRALAEIARGAAQGHRVAIAAADGEEMKRVARALLPQAIAQAGLDAAQVSIAELDEREGYLCLHRWFGVAREGHGLAVSPEITRGLAKLTVWAQETRTGQRADVALTGAESDAWARARSGGEFADTREECSYRINGYCFAERATQRAREASIVVTTQAALAGRLLGKATTPDESRIVLLDARQFEEELRRQQTITLDASSVLALLDRLASPGPDSARGGLLPLAASLASAKEDSNREPGWLDAVARARSAAFSLFGALRVVLQESQERNARGGANRNGSADGGSLRVDNAVRASRGWDALRDGWVSLSEGLKAVADSAREAASALATVTGQQEARALGARTDLLGLARRIEGLLEQGERVVTGQGQDQLVCWMRIPQPQHASQGQSEQPRGRRSSAGNGGANGSVTAESASATGATDDETSEPLLPAEEELAEREPHAEQAELLAEAPILYAAPAQVSALMASLLAEGRGVAALGWSLSVGGDFEYTRTALGFPETARALAATPDYSRQTLLCLPTDAPEPAAQSYHAQFEGLIVSLARALGGDVVAIFPSHAALRTAAMGIRRALERYDILTLAQGIDGSARQLWQSFNGQPRTVLLGAGSFWDGAEQREHPPACVVVARMPFLPQSDPLVAARADLWTDPQAQFMTPQAALKLRQALGGLAWSHSRRNAVVLFDKRLQTRSYGGTILGALPQCDLYQAPAADLAERIADWTSALSAR
ncbi:MAG TPA: exonuclease domain-containing protein [Ktedonobacterales bacterium]|nr:exonuclease domain-containing protein [Ktedonobacterales bacterium]